MNAGEVISILGELYRVDAQPGLPDAALSIEGRSALVTRVTRLRDSSKWALKTPRVPQRHWRTAPLQRLAALPQFKALEGHIIPASDALLGGSVIMRWVAGEPLTALIDIASDTRRTPYAADQASRIARDLAQAVESLHAEGLQHGDLSSANVSIDGPAARVQLLDLENLRPRTQQAAAGTLDGGGTHAYVHPRFSESGDSFALAVLSAEILCLSEPQMLEQFGADSLFAPEELAQSGAKVACVCASLARFSGTVVECFQRAFQAQRPADVPSATDWLAALRQGPRRVLAGRELRSNPTSSTARRSVRWHPDPARDNTNDSTRAGSSIWRPSRSRSR